MSLSDLLGTQRLPQSLEAGTDTLEPACGELVKEAAQVYEPEKTQLTGPNPTQEKDCWLDQRVVENLPQDFKKSKMGKDGTGVAGLILRKPGYCVAAVQVLSS